MDSDYLFNSKRLGFRNWKESDKNSFFLMNSNPLVMEHFPSLLTKSASDELLYKLQKHFLSYGYTYFAVDELSNGSLIGFIGIKNQDKV